jgi:hypothetical protein
MQICEPHEGSSAIQQAFFEFRKEIHGLPFLSKKKLTNMEPW